VVRYQCGTLMNAAAQRRQPRRGEGNSPNNPSFSAIAPALLYLLPPCSRPPYLKKNLIGFFICLIKICPNSYYTLTHQSRSLIITPVLVVPLW